MNDLDIFIFAAVAIFLISRLYAVLGKKTGAEPPPSVIKQATEQRVNADTVESDEKVADFKPVFSGPGAEGLEAIAGIDNSFLPRDFIRQAKQAYEMIVEAYSEGDKDMLSNLLQEDVYDVYVQAIDERETSGQEPMRLSRLKSAEIADAELLDGDVGQISVSFEAQLSDGENLRTAKEIWTFERALKSSNPAWLLSQVSEAS
jgi:predicted lipid-binding transport protein (Tim44 family)